MQVSISVGVAAIEARTKEFVHAFAAAETACKAANDRGRNRVEVYHEADESIVRRFTDINLISELRGAVAEHRLELNAQLIVPLGGHGGAPHFEILLRMIAENGEIVGPDHFMSAAQRYQLMPTHRSLGHRPRHRDAQAAQRAAGHQPGGVLDQLLRPVAAGHGFHRARRASSSRAAAWHPRRCASSSPRAPPSAICRAPRC